jgi:antitoxin (DNA-binding transcriptional repressor) of toxin-antitoxin stability system
MQVNIHYAKTNLSRLLELLENGSEQKIIVARAGIPVGEIWSYNAKAVESKQETPTVAKSAKKTKATNADKELTKTLPATETAVEDEIPAVPEFFKKTRPLGGLSGKLWLAEELI